MIRGLVRWVVALLVAPVAYLLAAAGFGALIGILRGLGAPVPMFALSAGPALGVATAIVAFAKVAGVR